MVLRKALIVTFVAVCSTAWCDITHDEAVNITKKMRARVVRGYGNRGNDTDVPKEKVSVGPHPAQELLTVIYGDYRALLYADSGRVHNFSLIEPVSNPQNHALIEGESGLTNAQLQELVTDFYHAAGENCTARIRKVKRYTDGRTKIVCHPVYDGHPVQSVDWVIVDSDTGRLISYEKWGTVLNHVQPKPVKITPQEVSARIASIAFARGTASTLVETEPAELVWWQPLAYGGAKLSDELLQLGKDRKAILSYKVRFSDPTRILPGTGETDGYWYDGWVDPQTGEVIIFWCFEDCLKNGIAGTPKINVAPKMPKWNWPAKAVYLLSPKDKVPVKRTDLDKVDKPKVPSMPGSSMSLVDGKRYFRAEYWKESKLLRIWTGINPEFFKARPSLVKRLAKCD